MNSCQQYLRQLGEQVRKDDDEWRVLAHRLGVSIDAAKSIIAVATQLGGR